MFTQRRLFLLQRVSAMLLAPLVVIHLLLILIAVRDGLSADEILERTGGSIFWASFYLLFVLCAAIHAPIGLRNVMQEWTPLTNKTAGFICLLFGIFLFASGLRAVIAVVLV